MENRNGIFTRFYDYFNRMQSNLLKNLETWFKFATFFGKIMAWACGKLESKILLGFSTTSIECRPHLKKNLENWYKFATFLVNVMAWAYGKLEWKFLLGLTK